jgi:hypothetical protein
MSIQYLQDLVVVVDMDDLMDSVKEFGGDHLLVAALIEHLREAKPVRRVLRRIHAIVGAAGIGEPILWELRRLRVDVHIARGGRPDCSVFLHAHRAAESCDVVGLIVAKDSYLPLLRHIKELGARVELHAGPSSNPALYPAADEVVALPSAVAECQSHGAHLVPTEPALRAYAATGG